MLYESLCLAHIPTPPGIQSSVIMTLSGESALMRTVLKEPDEVVSMPAKFHTVPACEMALIPVHGVNFWQSRALGSYN